MKSLKMLFATLVIVLLTGTSAQAGAVTTYSTVINVWTWTNYGGNGDVIITMAIPAPGCNGFWLSPTDPGFKQSFALVTAAFLTGKQVAIWGYDDQIWSGYAPTYKFCRVSNLGVY